MTDDLSHIRVLVPEDVTDAADLPMGVLDSACNHLNCDLVEAVRGEVPGKKYAAWAELCYQWARISGVDKPKRETYREYKAEEVAHALGWDRVQEADDEDPTPPVVSTVESNGSSSLSTSDVSPVLSTV